MNKLKKPIRKTLEKSFRLTRGEEVLIVTDEPKLSIAKAFAEEIQELGGDVNVYLLLEENRPFRKATDYFKKSMNCVSLLIYILEDRPQEKPFRTTMVSLGRRKGRVCMMPGITEDIVETSLDIDYDELAEFTYKLASELEGKEEIKVTDDKGTDITFSVKGRKFEREVGKVTRKGGYANLPSGETFTAPVEKTFTGKIYFDHLSDYASGKGMFEFEEGEVKNHEDIPEELLEIMKKKQNRVIGEFGVGTNPKARPDVNFLEAEKALNTVHFAIGDSYGLGKNKAEYHFDFLVKSPTVEADGKKIMEEGEFLI